MKHAEQLPWYLTTPGPHNYEAAPWHALDVETTNIDYGDAWNDDNRLVYESWRGGVPDYTAPWVLVAHNAKFELAWLARGGVDVSQILVWDTMIGEYVLAGNRSWKLDLGSVARRYGLPGKEPFVDALMEGGVCPSEMPEHLMRARCALDVHVTEVIAREQYRIMKEARLLPVMFTRCITTPVLMEIERQGMTLDPARVEAELRKEHAAVAALDAQLAAAAPGINFNSNKQLGEWLYGTLRIPELRRRDGTPMRTAAGRPRTDKAAIAALKAPKEARKLLDAYRDRAKAQARLTKALAFFDEVCKHRGGRFYGRFNQTVTQTHRLSASGRSIKCADGKLRGVQFQNLPREYKRLFKAARKGWLMVEVDGAGLEFRVAGHLGKDPQVRADIVNGADIHRHTASVMLGKPEAAITGKERTAAKAMTFAPLYGKTHGTPKELAYVEAFRRKYMALGAAQQRWVAEVLRTGALRTASGLVFYWPGTRVRRDGTADNQTNIYNYPIQSFATADIIPVSIVYTYWATQHLARRLVNTIHDSVVAEVAKKDVDKYLAISVDCWLDNTYEYLDKVYGQRMYVPLGVGMKVAEHWGDTDEEQKVTKEAVYDGHD